MPKIRFARRALSLWTMVLSCAWATSACRTSADSTVSGANAPVTRVVLVYMGGFNSCGRGSPLNLAALDQWNGIKRGIEARGIAVSWTLSCYDGWSSTAIRWISSAEPNRMYGNDWRAPGNPGQLFDEVKSLSEDFKHPIFVIGHSYGGWLATNLTAHLAERNGAHAQGAVHGLFTIDPISPYHCNQVGYAGTLAKSLNPLSRFLPPGGCEHAPPQYDGGDNQTYPLRIANTSAGLVHSLIVGAAREWRNFYQTRDYLHSSQIPAVNGLPFNFEVQYGWFVAGTPNSPHIRIHTEGDVWNTIQTAVLLRVNAAARNAMVAATPAPPTAPPPMTPQSAPSAAPAAMPVLTGRPPAAAEQAPAQPPAEELKKAELLIDDQGQAREGALNADDQAKLEAIYGEDDAGRKKGKPLP